MNRRIVAIVVHCAYTKRSQNTDISDVRRWHVEERGWSDVGYHYFIKANGRIQVGRHLDRIGAHVKGHNKKTIGICLAGGMSEQGKPENNFTADQLFSLRNLIDILRDWYPGVEVLGHRDLAPDRDCPCFDVQEWWNHGWIGTNSSSS